jgi:lambda family phage portal protein
MEPLIRPRVRVPAVSVRVPASGGVAASSDVETTHHAASRFAPDMRAWRGDRVSPDAALLREIDTISGRVDDLTRNNGIASGAERSFVDNVVGPRFTCKPTPLRKALGRDVKWAKDWSAKVAAEWETFANTIWFDAGLRHNFHDATRLMARSLFSSGAGLALPLWTSDDSRWRTRIMLVDIARLSTPRGMRDGPTMRGGIEIHARTGAPVAYHIRKSHPGDGWYLGVSQEWERVPAYHPWGRARVIHMFEAERVGQSRGKPAATAVARQFKMLDAYHREQMRQAVLDSMVFGSIETPMDADNLRQLLDGEDDPAGFWQKRIGEMGIRMQGGSLIALPPGTKISPFSPNRGESSLDAFTAVMLRHISAGLNMPYEAVSKDYSKSNYSSARAAFLEAWRFYMSVRQFIADHWATLVYELWFEEAVDKGRIPDCTREDYEANQVAWTRCRWIGAGRGWIDPLKEAKASTERLMTVSTLEDEAAEQGKDWDDVMEQRAEENSRARELGLPEPHRERAAASAGRSPIEPVDEDGEKEDDE